MTGELDIKGMFLALRGSIPENDGDRESFEAAASIAEVVVIDLHRIADALELIVTARLKGNAP